MPINNRDRREVLDLGCQRANLVETECCASQLDVGTSCQIKDPADLPFANVLTMGLSSSQGQARNPTITICAIARSGQDLQTTSYRLL
jgi:hypothetical protein